MSGLTLNLRTQRPSLDEHGREVWSVVDNAQSIPAPRVAVFLCDVWNGHYCTAAAERLDFMVPRMNQVLRAMRDAGAVIIHCPSDTMDVYADTPARKRALAVEKIDPPDDIEHDDPTIPIDCTPATCCDTPGCELDKGYDRQHDGIDIDDDRDYLCDDGPTCYAIVKKHDIERVIILGVHTNMCILHRTFGIKQLVRWGVNMTLVRDLTDAMYNPMTWPYVSHEQGTQLVIEYIEKFWCPTIDSDQLLPSSP